MIQWFLVLFFSPPPCLIFSPSLTTVLLSVAPVAGIKPGQFFWLSIILKGDFLAWLGKIWREDSHNGGGCGKASPGSRESWASTCNCSILFSRVCLLCSSDCPVAQKVIRAEAVSESQTRETKVKNMLKITGMWFALRELNFWIRTRGSSAKLGHEKLLSPKKMLGELWTFNNSGVQLPIVSACLMHRQDREIQESRQLKAFPFYLRNSLICFEI